MVRSKLSMDEERLRLDAFNLTASDREASVVVGITQENFRMWRISRNLPNKRKGGPGDTCTLCGKPRDKKIRAWCNACTNARYKEWSSRPEVHSRKVAYSRLRYLKLKLEVLGYYSDGRLECRCCGVINHRFLSIDHIEGRGNQHRREIGQPAGDRFYNWLKKNGFPIGYQVLCFNCNMAKRTGPCPHTEIDSESDI